MKIIIGSSTSKNVVEELKNELETIFKGNQITPHIEFTIAENKDKFLLEAETIPSFTTTLKGFVWGFTEGRKPKPKEYEAVTFPIVYGRDGLVATTHLKETGEVFIVLHDAQRNHVDEVVFGPEEKAADLISWLDAHYDW